MFEKLKKYSIVIPILTIIFWSIYALIHEGYFINHRIDDFGYFYNSSLRLLKNPATLYDDPHFYHLPSFSYAFSFFVLFPLRESHLILWGINIVFGLLFVLELNKTFKLLGVEKIVSRSFVILSACASWNIYSQFRQPQVKLIVVVILMFVIRRELERKGEEKSWSYYALNYCLMVFSLSIAPYLLFLYAILVVDDIGKSNLFKKDSLLKILLLIGFFVAQNFVLFVYFPQLIVDYLGGVSFVHIFYLVDIQEFFDVSFQFNSIPFLVSLIVINLYIAISNYDLEVKVGLSGLAYLFFNSYGSSETFIWLTLALFLFVIAFEQKETLATTIRENIFVVCGVASVFILNITFQYNITIEKSFPFLFRPPFELIMAMRWVIVLSFILASLVLVKMSADKKSSTDRKSI